MAATIPYRYVKQLNRWWRIDPRGVRTSVTSQTIIRQICALRTSGSTGFLLSQNPA